MIFLPSSRPEKLPIESRKEPSLDLGGISQLIPFARPDKKGLLSQIGGIRLAAGEADTKTKKG